MSGANDFDFWIGSWTVHHTRLRKRLAGCTEWDEFDGTSVARFLPAGMGNMDELTLDAMRPGLVGMTFRFFDPATQRWSIHWADSARCVLDPPMTGAFRDGVGVFYGDDHHEGTPVRVRFVWRHETPSTARWEQAFSVDGGATWETNWIMDMTRSA